MCGRFSLVQSKEDLEGHFKVKIPNDYAPRYNAAPTQFLPVILNEKPDTAEMVFWGLKPVWFHPGKKVYLNNVRTENLREKPTFKKDLMERRCLVLADGFYEWQATKEGKQPYCIVLRDKGPFAFAGIWEENVIDDEKVKTFAIITTTPNSVLLPIHNRMPVILAPGDERKWLEAPDLDLLNPYSPENMEAYRVNKAVNNVKNESPLLLKPLLFNS
jgi:putative SOS response-associated peptidase YedK